MIKRKESIDAEPRLQSSNDAKIDIELAVDTDSKDAASADKIPLSGRNVTVRQHFFSASGEEYPDQGHLLTWITHTGILSD